MTGGNLVLAATFANQTEAELARSRLEAAGIPAFVFSDNEGGQLPGISLTGGFRLMVPDTALDDVRALLGMDDDES